MNIRIYCVRDQELTEMSRDELQPDHLCFRCSACGLQVSIPGQKLEELRDKPFEETALSNRLGGQPLSAFDQFDGGEVPNAFLIKF